MLCACSVDIQRIMTLVPKLAGVINAAKGVFAAFNAVCAANPYVLIIAAIIALVAAWEAIKTTVFTTFKIAAIRIIKMNKKDTWP